MNLLPKKNKEQIKLGLKRRFFVVFLFAISSSFSIGIVTLVPTYVIINTNLKEAESNSFNQNVMVFEENSLNLEILKVPAEIESKMAVVQYHNQNKTFISYLRSVFEFLPESNMRINNFSFSRDKSYKENKGNWMMISGFSSNRDSLIKFTNDLRSSGMFSVVEVPVTDLTKETNLNFSINLVFKE